MSRPKTFTHDVNQAWLVVVPKRQEFTKPQFHFGERVKWSQEADGHRVYRTGRIFGITFTSAQQWQYKIHLDVESCSSEGEREATITEVALTLIPDSQSIRLQLQPEPDWQMTRVAAQKLGVSSEQLRKLRRKGLFKSGYHYRDISVPGSGKSRWQWHLTRCSQALESPSASRKIHVVR